VTGSRLKTIGHDFWSLSRPSDVDSLPVRRGDRVYSVLAMANCTSKRGPKTRSRERFVALSYLRGHCVLCPTVYALLDQSLSKFAFLSDFVPVLEKMQSGTHCIVHGVAG
jgi:hypothetical protein